MTRRINPYKMFHGIWIPNWLMSRREVTAGAKVCYGELCRFAQEKGHSWPSQETLGEAMGVSVRKVGRHIRELAENKLIEVVQRGLTRTNVYYFLDHPWIHEDTPADDDVPDEPSVDVSDLPDLSGQEPPDLSDRRESKEESHSSLRSEEDKSPSARNLNSSGEKMGEWLSFLIRLDGSRSMGILSPVDNPEAYARTAARSGSSPPEDVDIILLKSVAVCVQKGMKLKTVRMPGFEVMGETSAWFSRCRDGRGEDFCAWLVWASSQVKRTGSLANDKLLLYALTQVGTLRSFSDWQEARAATTPA